MRSAAERWRQQVEAHHEQTHRARERAADADYWGGGIAEQFRVDPSREDDPVLNRLLSFVAAETTVLDVGGGAGWFAVPLAQRCRRVTVVEPSAAMVEQLRIAAGEAGAGNIEVVEASWEDAMVESADIVLCAHVVYGVMDIEPFLRKLGDSATDRVVIVAHTVSPISVVGPFWKAVHGEERINLPGLPELVPVLWEMGVFPDVEMLEVSRGRSLPDRDMALMWLRRMTWVMPGSEKDEKLQAALETAFDAEQQAYVLRNERSLQGIITWTPEGARGRDA